MHLERRCQFKHEHRDFAGTENEKRLLNLTILEGALKRHGSFEIRGDPCLSGRPQFTRNFAENIFCIDKETGPDIFRHNSLVVGAEGDQEIVRVDNSDVYARGLKDTHLRRPLIPQLI